MSESLPLSQIARWVVEAQLRMNEGRSLANALDGVPVTARAAAQSLLYLCVRHRGLCESVEHDLVSRPPQPALRALLHLGIAALREQVFTPFTLVNQLVDAAKAIPDARGGSGFLNAVLRRLIREQKERFDRATRHDTVRFNVPQWWLDRIQRAYPDDWERILTVARRHPPMTLRVNVRKTTPEAYQKRLAEAGMASLRTGAEAVTLVKPVPVTALPGFAEGMVSVQDAGTQLAAHLLPVSPGACILDACAAPGGKTTHLLERFDCSVTALEIDPIRAKKIQETLTRLDLQARIITTDAADTEKWFDGQPFDAILLDAPCTASGIVRRQPDVPWIRRAEDIRALARQQKRLLQALWPLLKKGGHLLYCTCSIFPEEGTQQMESFLRVAKDAQLVPLCEGNAGMMPLLPTEEAWSGDIMRPGIHDGFFYALIRKQ